MANGTETVKWIWLDSDGQDEYGEFYTSFYAEKLQETICRISCDGDYTLYINGCFVESNQYGDFEHYKIYDEINITPFLREGRNDFAVLVWHFGEDTQRYKAAQAGLFFEIICDGKSLLGSDEKILCRKSKAYRSGARKKITVQQGFSFLYDATKEDDWKNGKLTGFNAAVAVKKECVFHLRPTKKLSVLSPKYSRVLRAEGKYYLIDLGEETVGLPHLNFYSEKEQKIIVHWGEDLQNGHVRAKIGDRDFSYEYIAKHGENSYTNYMLRLGCRYLELYSEKKIELKYLGVLPQVYPVEEKKFCLKNEMEQCIYDVSVRTLRLCMMEHYVDTPWREQCLYVFDARNQMLCGYYAFVDGNAEYARSNLKLISEDNRRDGLLSICYPCGVDLTIPSFSLYYFIAVREYMTYTGDIEFVREIYPKLFKIMETFLIHRKSGLLCKFSGENHWNFYDWSEELCGRIFESEEEVPDLIINCLFIIALENFKLISAALHKRFAYESVLEETRQMVSQAFYDRRADAFALTQGGKEFTALGNALAILSGVAENAKLLCEKLSNKNVFIPCSLSMKCFLYDALLATDTAYWKEYVLEEIRWDYSKMLGLGATSVWETIDGVQAFGNSGSLCHGWSAIPVYYYHKLRS